MVDVIRQHEEGEGVSAQDQIAWWLLSLDMGLA